MRRPSRKPITHYRDYFANWGLLGSVECQSSLINRKERKAGNLRETGWFPYFRWNTARTKAPKQGSSDVVAIQGGALRFGAWIFSGDWSLGFEASQPSHSTEHSEERGGFSPER
jgi:hypothetical protein